MIYIFPVKEREIIAESYGTKVAYVEIMGEGVKVKYDSSNFDLSPLNLSKYLIGIKDQGEFLVDANNPREAIENFYKEVEGSLVGLEKQAVQISKREPIQELPSCPFLKYNKNGNAVCIHGDEEEFEEREKDPDPNNVFGCGCVIDFSDYGPKICPVLNTWKMFKLDHNIEEIDGFKFKRLSQQGPRASKISMDKIHELAVKNPIRFAEDIAKQFHKAKKQHKKLKKIFKELKIEWPQ